jgi:exocyst complex component 4
MDQILVSMASKISAMNGNGCRRIQLNILVLQQNLKNIEPRAALNRSALYYDLFLAGPDAVISKAKDGGKACGFTYEEMKVLLELCYSEALSKEEGSVQAKRSLDEHLLELSEYLY